MKEDNTNGSEDNLPRAAIYARVSSTGQLGRDGDEDGYSIPAQVEAGKKKAADLGAVLDKAYIERAESARSDDRPVLQQMLKELPARGIKYLIVHKVDRLARNRLDDAVLYHQITEMGVTLVSVSENIDETPAGRLMHGMLATFAEYYSNNLATEIKKGLHQKHKLGGTPFRPPIGYKAVRKIQEGREVRTVEVDEERAPLVKLAFHLYGTGDWTLIKLAAHLKERGLRTRPTPKLPSRELTKTTVHKMLINPYYMGIVQYAGTRVVGRHDRLVDPVLFEKVQAVLVANRIGGDRSYRHEHYLRGLLYCEECGGRLLFGRHRSHTGRTYDYFSCTNRSARRGPRKCGSGHYSVADIEERIEQIYGTMRLPAAIARQVREELDRELSERHQLVAKEAEKHSRRIKSIEAKQAKLVQLYYKDLVSEDVLAAEQTKLREEKESADRLMSVASIESEEIDTALTDALRELANPERRYLDGTALERRLLNATMFKRIVVGENGDITDIVLRPIPRALKAWHEPLGENPRPRRRTSQGTVSSVHQVRQSSPTVH